MLITLYCNLIGTANIPAVHTKTCPNTPDVCFPSPLFGARNIRARTTYIRLARETTKVIYREGTDTISNFFLEYELRAILCSIVTHNYYSYVCVYSFETTNYTKYISYHDSMAAKKQSCELRELQIEKAYGTYRSISYIIYS